MKIEKIVLRRLSMKLKRPFETSFGQIEWRHCVLVEVFYDGIIAYGECAADEHPHYSYETAGTAMEIMQQELVPALLASSNVDPKDFQQASRGVKGHSMAKAGIEMALWDLKGKLEEKSMAELLGVKKKNVDVGVSIGIAPNVDQLLEIVDSYVTDGYGRVKLKIKPGRDIVEVQEVRNAFPELKLQVDANSAYSLENAKSLIAMDGLNLILIEQPLEEDDLWDHSQLQKMLSTPICLDESIISLRHARQAIAMQACEIINIKSGRVGGLLEAIEIHNFAVKNGVPVWCGGMLETGVGRAANLALAGLPGFSLPGDISASSRYYVEDIINEEFTLNKNSTIDIPIGHGLGVSIDREALEKATIDSKNFTI